MLAPIYIGNFDSISLRTLLATQAEMLETISVLKDQILELSSGQLQYPNLSFCGGEIFHNLNSGTTATSVMSYSNTPQDVYAFRVDPDTGLLFKVQVAQQLTFGNVRNSVGSNIVSIGQLKRS